jgi:hypothetical protein
MQQHPHLHVHHTLPSQCNHLMKCQHYQLIYHHLLLRHCSHRIKKSQLLPLSCDCIFSEITSWKSFTKFAFSPINTTTALGTLLGLMIWTMQDHHWWQHHLLIVKENLYDLQIKQVLSMSCWLWSFQNTTYLFQLLLGHRLWEIHFGSRV